MSLFRRQTTLDQATVRPIQATDQAMVRALLYSTDRRLLTSTTDQAIGRMADDPTLLLESHGRILGLVAAGWLLEPQAWLRTIALDTQVLVTEALAKLLPPLYRQLQTQNISRVAITVDDMNLPWLQGPLERLHYAAEIEVIGYEKVRMNVPDEGNQQVLVRPARPDDLAAVLHLDAECFGTTWVKGAEILQPAIEESPCFLVAELAGSVVGYAFAAIHQYGRLVHLVRIAVTPRLRGQAIGVRLLSEVVQYCARRGTVVLSLNTQADNRHAQRLYEWFGFVRNDERQVILHYDLAH